MTGSVTIGGQLYNCVVDAASGSPLSPPDRCMGLASFETHIVTVADGPLAEMRETAWHEMIECAFHENPALWLALRNTLSDDEFQKWIDALARILWGICSTAEWRDEAGTELLPKYRGGE